MQNVIKGAFGEKVAQIYLQKKGYKIVSTNWTCQWGELDIIAQKDERLIFVEVKYRSSLNYGYGFRSVNYHKLKHLHRTAQMFLTKNEMHDTDWQMDVVCITRLGQRIKLDHFEAIEL
jgi:putative endonuclease